MTPQGNETIWHIQQRLIERGHKITADGLLPSSPLRFDTSETLTTMLKELGGPIEIEADAKPIISASGRRVYIEKGHGPTPRGFDPGAIRMGTGVTEHHLNGIVAEAIHKRLTELGVHSVIGDTTNSNYSSGRQAKGYDLMISVHHNSFIDGRDAQGAEAIYDPRTRNPRSDKTLCKMLSKAMAEANGIPDRGAKPMRLSVLSGARSVGVPYSALIETYFVQRRPDDSPATADMPEWSRRGGVAAAEAVAEFLQLDFIKGAA